MPTRLRHGRAASLRLLAGVAGCLVAAAACAAPTIASAQGAPSAPAGNVAKAKRLAVTLRGGAFVGKESTLTVQQGDAVELVVDSDRPMMLHLHGYELTAQAAPGQPATIAFVAKIAGRFPVHQHSQGPENHRAVFFVEVHP